MIFIVNLTYKNKNYVHLVKNKRSIYFTINSFFSAVLQEHLYLLNEIDKDDLDHNNKQYFFKIKTDINGKLYVNIPLLKSLQNKLGITYNFWRTNSYSYLREHQLDQISFFSNKIKEKKSFLIDLAENT